VLSLSFTAEGFLGGCTGGSKENEFGVEEETTAQALSPTANPTEMAAKSKRDTFIQFKTTVNRAVRARAVKRMMALEMRFLRPTCTRSLSIGPRQIPPQVVAGHWLVVGVDLHGVCRLSVGDLSLTMRTLP
jgi:hypothetical protein